MPLVSVVVPVFNAEQYLKESLGSIATQTLRDIEVILVDDGSTDGSRLILEAFAASDSRFSVIDGPAVGRAGIARNYGLRRVTGEYTVFLDADDVFEPTFFEKLYRTAAREKSDLVIANFATFTDDVSISKRSPYTLKLDQIPEHQPFSPVDAGVFLFSFSHTVVWVTLYRTEFVRHEQIEFQGTRRFNDVYFNKTALATAKRISTLDETLVYHRVDNAESLQGSIKEAPVELFDTLAAIHAALERRGKLAELEKPFAELVANTSFGALKRCTNFRDYRDIHELVSNHIFPTYGIDVDSAEVLLRPEWHDRVTRLLSESVEDQLFDAFNQLQRVHEAIKHWKNKVTRAERRLAQLNNQSACPKSDCKIHATKQR